MPLAPSTAQAEWGHDERSVLFFTVGGETVQPLPGLSRTVMPQPAP